MEERIIDDVTGETTHCKTAWRLVSDTMMGGVSRGTLTQEHVLDRPARRMRAQVSLENNGGFVQMALDLTSAGGACDASNMVCDASNRVCDASDMDGLLLWVCGNEEEYNVHLRTRDLDRPWQSFRASFHAGRAWRQLLLPFRDFTPHRTEAELRLTQLHRIGLVAIGRPFEADLAMGRLAFFRASDAC